jgi:hypothetical protein
MLKRIFNKQHINLEIEKYTQLEKLIDGEIINLEVESNKPIIIDLVDSRPKVVYRDISTEFLKEIENSTSKSYFWPNEFRTISEKIKELADHIAKVFSKNQQTIHYSYVDLEELRELRIQQKFALLKLQKKVKRQKRNLLKSQTNYGLLIDLRKVIRQIIKKSIKLSFDDEESTYLFYFKPNMGLCSRLNKLNFKLSNNEEKYFRYH